MTNQACSCVHDAAIAKVGLALVTTGTTQRICFSVDRTNATQQRTWQRWAIAWWAFFVVLFSSYWPPKHQSCQKSVFREKHALYKKCQNFTMKGFTQTTIRVSLFFLISHPRAKFCPNPSSFWGDISENVFPAQSTILAWSLRLLADKKTWDTDTNMGRFLSSFTSTQTFTFQSSALCIY